MTTVATSPEPVLHSSFAGPFPLPYDQAALARQWEAWNEEADRLAGNDPALARFMREVSTSSCSCHTLLSALFGNSPFLSLCARREAAFLWQVLTEGPEAAWDTLGAYTLSLQDEPELNRLMRELRTGKRRLSLLAALADIGGAWELEQVTAALSDYASLALEVAASHLLRAGAAAGHILLLHPDDPCRGSGLVILGMGKLGARELNYSSDIDLICLYDPAIVRYVGRKSAGEFFVSLTKSLVRIMDERTGDGYVFRTDLRLRPDPASTAVCLSTDAAETYYESMGQNWERAAMIKARPVAGDLERGQQFLEHLRPFVWRKSLDFYAIRDIQSIKRQINAHKGGATVAVAGHNIKLGRGGIREIEFFAQTQQLIWGGREPGMRTSRTLKALVALVSHGHIEPSVAGGLEQAYRFLRRLEHRLQMIEDAQTQTLPASAEGLAHVGTFFGLADPAEFDQAVRQTLQRVEGHYAALFETAPGLSDGEGAQGGNLVFTGAEGNDPETLKTLAGLGFTTPETVCRQVQEWHRGRYRALRSTRARELLTELTPRLLRVLGQTAHPDQAFLRFDEFLSHLPTGVQIFSLMASNPALLELLAEILGNAPRLADLLARRPGILDAVMTPGFMEPLPGREVLAAELEALLAPATSYEEILDLCRLWANGRKFQVGVQSLRLLVDAREAGEALAAIADTVLAPLLRATGDEFARNHGRIPGSGMVVLALGKMGGREMTASSDLDLITVYDAPADSAPPDAGSSASATSGSPLMSDGARSLSLSEYYIRLTQRLVNALTVLTREGALYEVDLRLRPSGSKGPLAASLEAFQRYNGQDAWTWEHLALTRARVVCGDPALAHKVQQVIAGVLSRRRDPDQLLLDVARMRDLMARERKPAHSLDVKLMRGGLVDIEFLVQYLILRHSPDFPDLLCQNISDALLRLKADGILDAQDYLTLDLAHRRWLTVQGLLRHCLPEAVDPQHLPAEVRTLLCQACGEPDFPRLETALSESADAVFVLFGKLVEGPAAAAALRQQEIAEGNAQA